MGEGERGETEAKNCKKFIRRGARNFFVDRFELLPKILAFLCSASCVCLELRHNRPCEYNLYAKLGEDDFCGDSATEFSLSPFFVAPQPPLCFFFERGERKKAFGSFFFHTPLAQLFCQVGVKCIGHKRDAPQRNLESKEKKRKKK